MKSEILSLIQKKIEEISSIYNSTTGGILPNFDLIEEFERENGYTSVDEVLKIFNSNDNTSEITASDLLDSVDSIDENIDETKKLI